MKELMNAARDAQEIVFLAAVIATLFLAGCVTSSENQALRMVYQQHTKAVVASLTQSSSDPFSASNEFDRNRTIRQVIYLIDRNYEVWEKRIYERKAGSDFIGTVSVLGLNAAGALTGGIETKAILAAISGGIEGTRTAVDKDLLQGQNTLAIISKMRELRSARLTPLLNGMKRAIGAYPMEQAVVDLGEYYNAGTFTVALQDIIATSGKEKEKSDQANKSAKTNRTITTSTKTGAEGTIRTTTETTY